MNGISRGARLYAYYEEQPVAVIVLDKGPAGWWVALEDAPPRRAALTRIRAPRRAPIPHARRMRRGSGHQGEAVRTEVTALGSTLTAGELRAALAGVDDAAPVSVMGLHVEGAVGEDLGLNLTAEIDCSCGGEW